MSTRCFSFIWTKKINIKYIKVIVKVDFSSQFSFSFYSWNILKIFLFFTEWAYDYYTVSSTTRTCIGLSVLAVAVITILSVLAYHKKYRHRSRAVATGSSQSRGCSFIGSSTIHQSHLHPRNRRSRARTASRPGSFPGRPRQYNAVFAGAAPGFNNSYVAPLTAIPTEAFLPVTPPQPPPYTPREAPPAYTSEAITAQTMEGQDTDDDKPPSSPGHERY